MGNPHRVKMMQQASHLGGLFYARCAGCDREWSPQMLTDLYPKAVQHQLDHANDHDIYRRTDWQEPVEDT